MFAGATNCMSVAGAVFDKRLRRQRRSGAIVKYLAGKHLCINNALQH